MNRDTTRAAGAARDARGGRARPRLDRRDAIVATGLRQLARLGFEGLRIRDVAAEVGMHHATLLHYFPTKEALVLGLVDRFMTQFAAADEREGTSAASPSERVRAHHRAIRGRMASDPETFSVLNELAARAQRDAAVAAALSRATEAWAAHVRSLLEAARANGALAEPVDLEALVDLEIGLFQGLSLRVAGAISDGAARDDALRRVDRTIAVLETLLRLDEAPVRPA